MPGEITEYLRQEEIPEDHLVVNHTAQSSDEMELTREIAQDYAWLGVEYLQGWRLNKYPEQPVPVFNNLLIKKKKKQQLFFFFWDSFLVKAEANEALST